MHKLLLTTLGLLISYATFSKPSIELNMGQNTRIIKLLPIKISQHTISKIKSRFHQSMNFTASTKLASKVELGMNSVPVLDQGVHGTCSMFAVTAALDAIINKQDYISQICLLTLGQYLSNNTYQISGWDGSHNDTIIHQILTHGIINKTTEQNHGCAGLTKYPLYNENYPTNELPVYEFHALSEKIPNDSAFNFTHLLDFRQFSLQQKKAQEIINMIKTSLAEGDRVLLSVIITSNDGPGAYGAFHKSNDSWVLTPEVISAFKSENIGGHALVITGYDDYAIAKDKQGKLHRGLFTLRNSWGELAGDYGNYYMSYEYMANLAYDLISVRK